jgi:hypothetical protein
MERDETDRATQLYRELCEFLTKHETVEELLFPRCGALRNLIMGWARLRNWDKAFSLYDELGSLADTYPAESAPTSMLGSSAVSLISALLDAKRLDDAKKVFQGLPLSSAGSDDEGELRWYKCACALLLLPVLYDAGDIEDARAMLEQYSEDLLSDEVRNFSRQVLSVEEAAKGYDVASLLGTDL